MNFERRESKRYNYRIPLFYRSLDLKDFLNAKTDDISSGGFAARIKLHIHPGKLIEFKLLMPKGHDLVSAIGVVTWTKRVGPCEYDVGIKTIDVGTDYKEKIEASEKVFSENN